MSKPSSKRYIVWGLVVFLLVIHQDIWFWGDTTLVMGFMPVTLLYHAGISLAAGITWFLATKWAWPEEVIESVDADQQGDVQ